MNKKLLIFGLIIIIATGFYINGLLNAHDNIITTSAGTNVTVPYKHFDLQSNNSAEVFGHEFQDEFTYVISFNATENPEMYQELCNIICQGQRYKDEDTGVVFYQDVSKKLENEYTFHGHNLKLANDYFNGGILLNNETGECIIVVSTIGQDVIDILNSIEWGNKIIKTTNETMNTTLLSSTESDTEAATTEPVEEETSTDGTTNAYELYKSQFNQKDGEPKGETLNEEYIESLPDGLSGQELADYCEEHPPEDYK